VLDVIKSRRARACAARPDEGVVTGQGAGGLGHPGRQLGPDVSGRHSSAISAASRRYGSITESDVSTRSTAVTRRHRLGGARLAGDEHVPHRGQRHAARQGRWAAPGRLGPYRAERLAGSGRVVREREVVVVQEVDAGRQLDGSPRLVHSRPPAPTDQARTVVVIHATPPAGDAAHPPPGRERQHGGGAVPFEVSGRFGRPSHPATHRPRSRPLVRQASIRSCIVVVPRRAGEVGRHAGREVRLADVVHQLKQHRRTLG